MMKRNERKRIQRRIRNNLKHGALVKIVQPDSNLTKDQPPTIHDIMMLDKNTFFNHPDITSFVRPFFPYEMPNVQIQHLQITSVLVMKLSPHEIKRLPMTQAELLQYQNGTMSVETFQTLIKDRSTYDIILEGE